MRDSHFAHLYDSFADADPGLWTYMSIGPFSGRSQFAADLNAMIDRPDWLPFTIVENGRPLGFAAYLRIEPGAGVIEIGSIALSPAIQQTRSATEAIYLMIDRVFDLGYRRCEWKCDSLNAASRRSAERFGFSYEGTFRQATHYKGRNRDTSWYSIVDGEWPAIGTVYRQWLAEENFDASGRQKQSLSQMMSRVEHLLPRGD